MDTENVVVLSLTAIVMSIVISVAVYNINENLLIAKALESGATSNQIICSFDAPVSSSDKNLLCGSR